MGCQPARMAPRRRRVHPDPGGRELEFRAGEASSFVEDRGVSGLTRGRGTPPTTIVTALDRVQARFEAGDKVSFRARDGAKRIGAIEKLNPKRAVVRSEGEKWAVPYHLLDHCDETHRPGNVQRLLEVAEQARALMNQHGLEEWTFRFIAAQRKLGECRERERAILLSRRHAVSGTPGEVRDTILHEIAHALAGAKARHGPAWKLVAKRIGATPRARAEESEEIRRSTQAAKARFRAGMEVSFRSRGNRRQTGVIVKMNPKRARVNCLGTVFLVPYLALELFESGKREVSRD